MTTRQYHAQRRRIEILRRARQHGEVRAVQHPLDPDEVSAQVVRFLVKEGLMEAVRVPGEGYGVKARRVHRLTQQGHAYLNGLESSDAS